MTTVPPPAAVRTSAPPPVPDRAQPHPGPAHRGRAAAPWPASTVMATGPPSRAACSRTAAARHRIIDHFAAARPRDGLADLTPREREILQLLADGCTNAAIAVRLHLSPKTVRNHVSSIFAKLHLTGRAEAMLHARRAGLGRP
ncbi:LuxR C-terminal-related transcriptional regulator [Dactylosporangium sp. NPDC051541]|uniref:response regulator transcription factor n=1 Tax=Dactylosporangium sp. NPDC051541 TaxID=3363977 RepID=UPI0037992D35